MIIIYILDYEVIFFLTLDKSMAFIQNFNMCKISKNMIQNVYIDIYFKRI